MTDQELKDLFHSVRQRFFSRWDPGKAWTLRWGTDEQLHNNTGYCETKLKTIYLNRYDFSSMTDIGRIAFVIHEICHDTGAAFHNRRWALKIEAAAKIAAIKGDDELSDQIRNEIMGYFPNFLEFEYCELEVSSYVGKRAFAAPGLTRDEAIKLAASFFRVHLKKVERDFGKCIQFECNEAAEYFSEAAE
jgi:hypothetical protein